MAILQPFLAIFQPFLRIIFTPLVFLFFPLRVPISPSTNLTLTPFLSLFLVQNAPGLFPRPPHGSLVSIPHVDREEEWTLSPTFHYSISSLHAPREEERMVPSPPTPSRFTRCRPPRSWLTGIASITIIVFYIILPIIDSLKRVKKRK